MVQHDDLSIAQGADPDATSLEFWKRRLRPLSDGLGEQHVGQMRIAGVAVRLVHCVFPSIELCFEGHHLSRLRYRDDVRAPALIEELARRAQDVPRVCPGLQTRDERAHQSRLGPEGAWLLLHRSLLATSHSRRDGSTCRSRLPASIRPPSLAFTFLSWALTASPRPGVGTRVPRAQAVCSLGGGWRCTPLPTPIPAGLVEKAAIELANLPPRECRCVLWGELPDTPFRTSFHRNLVSSTIRL